MIKKMFTPVMILSITLIAGTGLSSCKKNKVTKEVVGTEMKTLPCQGPRFSTDDKFFRASQIGTSSDLSLAKEKALTLTKQQLAGFIQSKMKSVTDRYVNEREIGNKSEFSQKFENLTREVVEQTLTDIRVACEQPTMLDDGRYRIFIALEISKDDLFNSVNNRISRQDIIQLEYDKSKFEQIFNEEMRKVEEERR
jgi:hypothetical protein